MELHDPAAPAAAIIVAVIVRSRLTAPGAVIPARRRGEPRPGTAQPRGAQTQEEEHRRLSSAQGHRYNVFGLVANLPLSDADSSSNHRVAPFYQANDVAGARSADRDRCRHRVLQNDLWPFGRGAADDLCGSRSGGAV